jgi:sulfonate transport system substrate-binding protein
MTRRLASPLRLLLLAAVPAIFSNASSAVAEDKPKEIRLGFPQVGVGNRPIATGSALATAHLRGSFEEEFKKDGIEIKWNFLRGAGPAVNELYANGLLDFSTLGDLPSIIGRSSGLQYRVLAGASVRGHIYFSVPADSPVQSLKDLKGKRVAVAKGTATHLAGVKILEKFGLAENDVKLINMDTATAQAAIVTRDVDAAIGSQDYLRLRDQGVSRVVYTTRGNDVTLTSNSTFLGSEAFIQKYPELTVRVLKVIVKNSKWLAETQNTQIYQLWTKSGTTFSSFREDLQGEDFKYRYSPHTDAYLAARYKFQIDQSKRLKLLRNTFSYEEWIQPKFLQQALKELGLENYWQQRGLDGKPLQPETNHAATPPAAAPAAAANTPAAAPAGG